MMNNAIRSEGELLKVVRSSIEAGYIPILTINGETYDFPLTYLMTDGDHCAWHCKNGLCGLASWTAEENPTCEGTPDDIEKCRRIR